MLRIAVDPTILAHGWVFVGPRRRLLVLFALARLRQLAEEPDLQLMQDLARQHPGATVHGGVALDRAKVERLIERIAPAAPTDLALVGSKPLFDAVTATAEADCRSDPDLYELMLAGRIEPLALGYVTIPGQAKVPSDPSRQTLQVAVHGRCDVVVSDVLARRYGGGPARMPAGSRSFELMSFLHFVQRHVNRPGFTLDRINPRYAGPLAKLLQSIHPNRARL